MSSHILVPFILLGYEGRDEYGWISRKAIMKLSSERISSLEEEIFRDIQTKFAHIVDPVALDYYSLDRTLQGSADQLKDACKPFTDEDALVEAGAWIDPDVTFESLPVTFSGRELKDSGNWDTTRYFNLLVIAHLSLPQVKRQRVGDEKLAEWQFFENMRKMYWKQPLNIQTQTIKKSDLHRPSDELSMDHLEGFPYIEFPVGQPFSKLLVREDYEIIYKDLKDTQKAHVKGVVVCGHPGIGKSYFLYYALAKRLTEGEPTIFTEDSHQIVYYFDHHGCQHFHPTELSKMTFSKGTWALIDADGESTPPPAELVHERRAKHFYPVLAASPQQGRYKGWLTQKMGIMLWMKPWTWDEMWAGSHLHPDTKGNEAKLRHLFDKYGGSARVVYAACIGLIGVKVVYDIDAAVSNMDMERLQSIQMKSIEETWHDSASSKLFVVRPSLESRQIARFDVASDYVLKLLMERFAKTFDAFADTITRILKGVDRIAATRGMFFEVVCHRKLMNGSKTFPLTKMTSKRHDVNTAFFVPPDGLPEKELRLLEERSAVHFGEKSCPSISSDCPGYYMPRASNHPTFDSFLVSDGELYVFQFTVSDKHDSSERGLGMLKKHVQDKAIKKWNFVCVVPESQQVKLFVPNQHAADFKKHFDVYILQMPDVQILDQLEEVDSMVDVDDSTVVDSVDATTQ